MNELELKAYARDQITKAAKDVDYVGLFESYPEYAGDDEAELSDDDGRKVDDLIRAATVTVMFPGDELSSEIETFRRAIAEWGTFAETVGTQQSQLLTLLEDLRATNPDPAPYSTVGTVIERLGSILGREG